MIAATNNAIGLEIYLKGEDIHFVGYFPGESENTWTEGIVPLPALRDELVAGREGLNLAKYEDEEAETGILEGVCISFLGSEAKVFLPPNSEGRDLVVVDKGRLLSRLRKLAG